MPAAGCLLCTALLQGDIEHVRLYPTHCSPVTISMCRPFSLSDIEGVDISFYNSLVYLQENDPEDLELNFSVEEECFGEVYNDDYVV